MGGLPSQGGGGPKPPRHIRIPDTVDVEVTNEPRVTTSISGNIVQISGQQVEISGQPITISGQPVTVSGNVVQISGQIVQISGQIVVTSVSGNIVISKISGEIVNISGQTIIVGPPTNPVINFNTVENVASNTSSTHTYTATGNFNLSKIEASASGAMRIDVKSGNSGLETTKLVAFTTESNLIAYLFFNNELQITSGQTILVVRTNRELQTMDVFSTIMGFNI